METLDKDKIYKLKKSLMKQIDRMDGPALVDCCYHMACCYYECLDENEGVLATEFIDAFTKALDEQGLLV